MATAALGLAKAIKAMRDSQDYKAVFDLYAAHRFLYRGPDVVRETLHVVDVIGSHRWREPDATTPEEQIAGLLAAGDELNDLVTMAKNAAGNVSSNTLTRQPDVADLTYLLEGPMQRTAQGSWEAAKSICTG